MERAVRPLRADETTTLRAFLDFQRETLRMKCSGLSPEQLSRSLPPGDLTLGGLLKHLASVESDWFEETFAGRSLMPPFDSVDWEADPDWDWRTARNNAPAELFALFDEAVRRADAVIDEALGDGGVGLDLLSAVAPDERGHFSLRRILVHLIEEYARHNGHADLIRQSIDGQTGQ